MSYDAIETEIVLHENGLRYDIEWSYDNDTGSPIEFDSGIVVTFNFDVLDPEELDEYIADAGVSFEEETRLRLIRPLRISRFGSSLYYDYFSTLDKARTEWGCNTTEDAVESVERDYEYLRSWYNDEWHWLTLSAAPIDEETDEILEQFRAYIGGFESTILDGSDKEFKKEAIADIIQEAEYNRKREANPMQKELSFT